MVSSYDKLSQDIETVKQISIIPTLLEVVCRTTGMGFAAVARVTQDRWIACSVRDEIQFGLEPGGELPVKTTICNEIRDSRLPVVIDHVAESLEFCQHHTPRLYGFQSYISVPIILKNGDFFGTLCAIDPHPAELNNTKTIGMFTLFSELISFHLHSMEVLQQSQEAIEDLNKQLSDSIEGNRQYQFISDHNLQEPLRKLRFFTNMLLDDNIIKRPEKTKELAFKINKSAQRFSMMIKDLSEFSQLHHENKAFEIVDLNNVVADVAAQLNLSTGKIDAAVTIRQRLPALPAIPHYIEQLFFHLMNNALKFCKPDLPLSIDISSQEVSRESCKAMGLSEKRSKYVEIKIQDTGIGINQQNLKSIFDLFSQLKNEPSLEGSGVGLAYCRKIVQLHDGIISAHSDLGKGTKISIILPVQR